MSGEFCRGDFLTGGILSEGFFRGDFCGWIFSGGIMSGGFYPVTMQNTEETIPKYAVDANLFRLGSTDRKKKKLVGGKFLNLL